MLIAFEIEKGSRCILQAQKSIVATIKNAQTLASYISEKFGANEVSKKVALYSIVASAHFATSHLKTDALADYEFASH